MNSELIDLWNNLSLTEEEESGVQISSDEFYKPQAWIPNFLIGKLLTKKLFNRLAFKNTMMSAWKVMNIVRIKELGENLSLPISE